ncbi:hypothetical protein LDO31_14720 [Luteimonas sp. XNQY3]|nr:hypothetical protein [Luteimonas sp. XNQY3]MCD9007470.1 hypothetical protein [Luteimonas sp. XNQY3]
MPDILPSPRCFKLVGRRAVQCESVMEWSAWFATADLRVAGTWVDDVRISTVFLGIDHNPFSEGDPALFETMVFVDGEESTVRRCFIWEEAEAGHEEMVALVHAEMERAKVRAGAAWDTLRQRLLDQV